MLEVTPMEGRAGHLETTWQGNARLPGGAFRNARWQKPPGPPGNWLTWHFSGNTPPGTCLLYTNVNVRCDRAIKTSLIFLVNARWAPRQVAPGEGPARWRQVRAPPGSRQVAFCARWDSQVSQVAPGELCARWARWSVRQVAPGGPCARWTFGIMSAAPRD